MNVFAGIALLVFFGLFTSLAVLALLFAAQAAAMKRRK